MEKSSGLDYRRYKNVWSPFSKLLFQRIISHTAQQLIGSGDLCTQDSDRSWISVKLLDSLDPSFHSSYLSSKPPSPPPTAFSSLFPSLLLLPIPHNPLALAHPDIFFCTGRFVFSNQWSSLWNWRIAINILYVALKPLHLDYAFCFFIPIHRHLINAYWLSS